MLTHAAINRRFVALDTDQRLTTEVFDGWLAWPIVKERLWLACLLTASREPARRTSLIKKVHRVVAGAAQIITQFVVPQGGKQALLYEPREVVLPGGRVAHPHLGTRPYDGQPAFRCVYGASGGLWQDGAMADHGVSAVLAVLANVLRRRPGIRAAARRLTDAVADACPELPRAALDNMIADQLARFRLRARLFRWLFRRAGVQSVVVLDPDSKVAEVAAARSLGIPVTEVQHGMFSAREPDYSWSAVHRALPVPLPLPDRILVFGAFWRDEILRAGYWTADEVEQVRNPLVAAYRVVRHSHARQKVGGPLRILFASQGYIRATALDFWESVLTQWETTSDAKAGLRIKLHPLEEEYRYEYEALARRFPNYCTVVPSSVDAFEELLETDLLVGYTSLMMLEATGIGVPVIGLRGGAAADGFAATFGLDPAATGIEECTSPACFIARIRAFSDAQCPRSRGCGAPVIRSIFDHDGPDVEAVLSRT